MRSRAPRHHQGSIWDQSEVSGSAAAPCRSEEAALPSGTGSGTRRTARAGRSPRGVVGPGKHKLRATRRATRCASPLSSPAEIFCGNSKRLWLTSRITVRRGKRQRIHLIAPDSTWTEPRVKRGAPLSTGAAPQSSPCDIPPHVRSAQANRPGKAAPRFGCGQAASSVPKRRAKEKVYPLVPGSAVCRP